MMEMATTYTKTVSMLGVEIMALRDTIVVLHTLAHTLESMGARRELLARVTVLEKLTNQLL